MDIFKSLLECCFCFSYCEINLRSSADCEIISPFFKVSSLWKVSYKLTKLFNHPDLMGPLRAAATIKTRIEKFKINMPLITALCTPGIKPRHWEQMSLKVGRFPFYLLFKIAKSTVLAKINCIAEQFLLYFVFVVSFPQIVLLPPLPPYTILTVETHYFPVSYTIFRFSRSATILLLRLTLRLARCWHLVSRDMLTSSPKSVLKPVKNMLSKRFFEFLVYAFLID